MLADFCHALWDTRIDSDTVSSEGYEVSNLISRDKFKKKRGFLAARFVKPVVTILVSFPFPVDLYAVNVNPQVGAQKTCSLEMFSASLKSRNDQDKSSTVSVVTPVATQEKDDHSTRSCPSITRSTGQRCQDISAFHLYQYDLNIDNVKQEFKNLFVQILRVRISEGNVGHFVNPCFQQNSQVHCDSRIVGNASSNVHKCMLQHGHSLRSVSHLLIKITQVHRGSVPCLGAVEMFGQPAQNSHPFVMNYASIISSRLKREKQNVNNGLFGVAKPDNSLASTCLSSGNAKGSKSTVLIQNGENCAVDNVPDDFIDPITLNVMTLPVLLPSGTTIDHTTLEKHIACEKSWGRSPSDPFTGLPLGSKVVPNASLKCRIDNFLLSSDVDISNLGRAIGSLTDCQSTTKLKFNAVKQRNKRTTCARGVDDSEPPLKRHSPGVDHFSDSLDLALEEALNVRRHPVHEFCSKNVSVSSLVPTYGSKAKGSKMNLERENSAGEASRGCPHQEQGEKLFQLPCQHIICRGCLTHATERNQCPNCKRNFDRKSIVRVHSVKTPRD